MNWYAIAYRYRGLKEEHGTKNNPQVVLMWKNVHMPWIRDDATPWCAAFVGSCLEECGITSSRSAAALSYRNWGEKLDHPVKGAIAYMERRDATGHLVGGHVGFVAGVDTRGNILLLGGNQGDMVDIKAFPKKRILGYRWPPGVPVLNVLPTYLDTVEVSQKET